MKQGIVDTKPKPLKVLRIAYIAYLLLVGYQLFIGEYAWAVSNFGIAMVFDPFDSSVAWKNRPGYQKIWLYTHLALTFGGFAFLLFIL